jgi:hypothetical protein
MIDVALGIEALLPAPQYFGSVTANTKEAFDNLNWQDERAKPTWKQVQDAYTALPEKIKNPEKYAAETKAAAHAKLAALGLTVEDLTALGL